MLLWWPESLGCLATWSVACSHLSLCVKCVCPLNGREKQTQRKKIYRKHINLDSSAFVHFGRCLDGRHVSWRAPYVFRRPNVGPQFESWAVCWLSINWVLPLPCWVFLVVFLEAPASEKRPSNPPPLLSTFGEIWRPLLHLLPHLGEFHHSFSCSFLHRHFVRGLSRANPLEFWDEN